MPPNLLSALQLSIFGFGSKAFLNFASKGVRTEGLQHLLKALEEKPYDVKGKGKALVDEVGGGEAIGLANRSRRGRRGIVTICNHTSVVDDPMAWGVMPLSTFFPFATPRHTSRNTRWALGASDIMFTNPLFSRFFRSGQVIETVRGGGVFQPAIDEAVEKLGRGEWIHIFPEGLVNQPSLNPPGGLRRFKWGVSRIIMDAEEMPEVIPVWLSGFENIMPDTRKHLRFLPRPGHRASITIGAPITGLVEPIVREWKRRAAQMETGSSSSGADVRSGGSSGADGGIGIGGQWGDASSNDSIKTLLSAEPDAQTRLFLAQTLQPARQARQAGDLLDGQEREWRIKICGLLWEELTKLGVGVEEREGKVGNVWRNAVRRGEGGYDPSRK